MKNFYIFLIILAKLKGSISSEQNLRIETKIEAPYQVAIMLINTEGDYKFRCGGALISMQNSLTAAHCVVSNDNVLVPPTLIRTYSEGDGFYSDENITYSETKWIKVHPQYRNFRSMLWNDIGIIKLKTPFLETEFVKPVSLRFSPIQVGTFCKITGWGTSVSGAKPSRTLKEAMIPIYDKHNCSVSYQNITGFPLHPGTICAGHEKGGLMACKGDSGGPLVCNGLLTGISSFSKGCGEVGYPGIYTETSQYVDWITAPQRCDGNKLTPDPYAILITLIPLGFSIELIHIVIQLIP